MNEFLSIFSIRHPSKRVRDKLGETADQRTLRPMVIVPARRLLAQYTSVSRTCPSDNWAIRQEGISVVALLTAESTNALIFSVWEIYFSFINAAILPNASTRRDYSRILTSTPKVKGLNWRFRNLELTVIMIMFDCMVGKLLSIAAICFRFEPLEV